MPTDKIKSLLIETGRRLYERSLVVASEGNLSARDNSGRIYITATGTCLGRLKSREVVIIGANSPVMKGPQKPSSEYRLHLAAYKGRPDIMACCHAHPPYTTAFGVVDIKFPMPFLPEAVLFVGEVAMIDYATPGSEALAKNLGKHLEGHNAFIMKNHGVLTLGRTMDEAFARMEMLENLARIAYIASALGKINPLDQDEIRRLEKMGKSFNSNRSVDD